MFIQSEVVQVQEVKQDTGYDIEIKIKSKKINSIKTILTKQNEELINEEIIKYILLNIKNNITEELDNFKIEFIEVLKFKLKLKRITNNDKLLVNKKFDEIYSVIIHT